MNFKKIGLLGFSSALLVILTSILGVEGTVIGSLITSVLYNTLSQVLDEPISAPSLKRDFEWEVAYIFPLIVIGLIQLLLIFAMLSEVGFLPQTFLNAFLSLQSMTNYNLYRILGISMLIISVYPIIVKPDIIKKSDGAIIAFVGLIFLARGFVDLDNSITRIYDIVFAMFDFPIALIALILIVFVIYRILHSARDKKDDVKSSHEINKRNFSRKRVVNQHHSSKHGDFDYEEKMQGIRNKRRIVESKSKSEVNFKNHNDDEMHPPSGINKSTSKIQFESNDLLDDYKK